MKKLNHFFSLALIVALLLSLNTQAQERKRWSPQAKGAVIGTGTGAAAGAIIHKRNRTVGGVVGGVVGGATGYAIGKRVDNKNKEAARVAAANRAAAERAAANRAEANRVAYAKKSTSTKATTASKSTPAATQNGLVGSPAPMALVANGQQFAGFANAAYLPNPFYGDRSKPYSDLEYRRKSW